jgi:hypothetical protein
MRVRIARDNWPGSAAVGTEWVAAYEQELSIILAES